MEQVEAEIDKVLNQVNIDNYGIGQTLYYELPFFTNPIYHIKKWCWDALEDYKIVTTYNVPLGNNLDEIPVHRIDYFAVIEDEINKINKHNKAKDG